MRGLPSFGPRLPSDVAERLGVRRGEKVVAWGCGPGADVTQATYVLATDRALYVEVGHERFPWSSISKASWDEPMFDVVVLDDAGRPSRLLHLRVDDARDLPPAVHDRVTASVVVTERVDLGDGAKALLVARRGSDDGEIRWSVVFDAGLDSRDPALRASADAALAQLRGSLGI